ncbi:MAG: HAD-IA family hydrolase [Chloroflexales bacterium]|nr:HAD-IA family hydrolase [Chloroflexales bacterium]
MNIRTVIFDRDNTLLYFEPHALEAFGAQITIVAPHLSLDSVLAVWSNWPGPWPRDSAEESAFWRHFWNSATEGCDLDDGQINALCDIGATYYTCFATFDDTATCLQALQTVGMRLALLTNFELPSIERTLEHVGVDPGLFALVASQTTLGVRKPDPRAFYAVADMLGESLEYCAVVDDCSDNVNAARSLGMRAFLIDRNRSTHDFANDQLASLEPLPSLLLDSPGDKGRHPLRSDVTSYDMLS